MFLDLFNGVTSHKRVDLSNDYDLELFTDSAVAVSLGCGADMGPFNIPEQIKGVEGQQFIC